MGVGQRMAHYHYTAINRVYLLKDFLFVVVCCVVGFQLIVELMPALSPIVVILAVKSPKIAAGDDSIHSICACWPSHFAYPFADSLLPSCSQSDFG